MSRKDLNDDALVYLDDAERLAAWVELPVEQLHLIFLEAVSRGEVGIQKRLEAQDLVYWCLNRDPAQRPTMQQVITVNWTVSHSWVCWQVIAHPFMTADEGVISGFSHLDLLGVSP